MKKIHFRLVYLAILTLFAQQTWAQSIVENSLLWEISGKDLKKPSYLMGTIHLLCPADLQLSETTKSKLLETEKLALEIDMDDPKLLMTMQGGMIMNDGKHIKNYLSEADYAQAAAFFKDSIGFPLEQMGIMKPFFLSTLLYPKMLECQPVSMETELMQIAKTKNIEVVGVESIQDQLAMVDKIPREAQANMLMENIQEFNKWKAVFSEMVEMYKSEKINELYEMANTYSSSLAEFEELMLVERNEKWIPVIGSMASAQPTFFAVGSAHLAGEKGVVHLLRKAGYQVRPVVQQ
jgi:uncharacterized protein YbaP (TraB family)